MTSKDLVRFADAIDGRSGLPRRLEASTIALMETTDPRIGRKTAGFSWVVEPGAWSRVGAAVMPETVGSRGQD
ncbi:hypothetical protein [Polaromonas sp. YR568]|uniref:hypothetical protein n=1 Tax=Polaromonas sp. YR568 TaxID=1855301 RepID=UPI00398C0077